MGHLVQANGLKFFVSLVYFLLIKRENIYFFSLVN